MQDIELKIDSELSTGVGTVEVIGITNIFAPHLRYTGIAPAGINVYDTIVKLCKMAGVPKNMYSYGQATLNGQRIYYNDWKNICTQNGDSLIFIVIPKGNIFNSLFKLLGVIAAVALTVVTGGMTAPLLFGLTGATWGLIGAGAILIGTSFLADTLFPPKMPKFDMGGDLLSSPTYSLTSSSNNMRTGSPIPIILGRHLVAPSRIIDDITTLDRQDEYLNFHAVFGIGRLRLYDVYMGEARISDWRDYTMQLREGFVGEQPINIIPYSLKQEVFNLELTSQNSYGEVMPKYNWWVQQTTPADINYISIDLQAPSGLYGLNDDGGKYHITEYIEAEYAPVDTNNWSAINQGIVPNVLYLQSGYTSYIAGHWEEYRDGVGSYSGAWVEEQVSYPIERKIILYLNLLTMQIEADISIQNVLGNIISAYFGNPQYVQVGYVTVYADNITGVSLSYGINYRTSRLTLYIDSGIIYGINAIFLQGMRSEPSKHIRKTFAFYVPHGKYKVRVRRSNENSKDSRKVDKIFWTALRSGNTNEQPIRTSIPLAQIGLKVLATNQLSGRLPVITAVAESIIPDWDRYSRKWVVRFTNNPASCFREVLQGKGNLRPLKDSDIDLETLQQWHEFCSDQGFSCNMVIDTVRDIRDWLSDVAYTGRGNWSYNRNGQITVSWHRRQNGMPKGHITLLNSRNFSSNLAYAPEVHGYKITYINESLRWEKSELIVYKQGYNKYNATKFEKKELFGVTNSPQVAILGRFMLLQLEYFKEQYQCDMPLEYMMLQFGDKVRVVRPEIFYGNGAALLEDVIVNEDNDIISIRFFSQIELTKDVEYLAIIRTGDNKELPMLGTSDDGFLFKLKYPVSYSFPPKQQDLVMVGIPQTVGRELLVTEIKPNSDFSATVSFIDYVPEVYDRDGTVPPYDPMITEQGNVALQRPLPISFVQVISDESALIKTSAGTQARIYAVIEYHDMLGQYTMCEISSAGANQWRAMPITSNIRETGVFFTEVTEKLKYDLRVATLGEFGVRSEWTYYLNHYVIGRTTPPPAPIRVYVEDSIIKWDMMPNAPIDIVGWEVYIVGDENDPPEYGLLMNKPYTVMQEISISKYSGRARRVYIRTIDELGLTSSFVSVSINMGDEPVRNVILELNENETGWIGNFINCQEIDNKVVVNGMFKFWGQENFWG